MQWHRGAYKRSGAVDTGHDSPYTRA